jgi:Rrf2 family protein
MTREIAERQNLPETYLEQLMLAMRKAGLLSSVRGAKGGYMLAKRAEDISLASIVVALEGALNIADCADVPNCCITPESCALKDVFAEVNQALYDAFERISLADLAHRQQSKDLESTPMYFI